MAISTYTTRVTKLKDKITAWVDKDGELCIEQPNHPSLLHTEENWSSIDDAQAWADAEVIKLTNIAIKLEADATAAAEKETQEAAARQAILDNAAKVDEIHAMLKQLTGNN